MIRVDKTDGVRLVTDPLPHRAENNLTVATSGIRQNAPESERVREYRRVLRLRRLERKLLSRE